MFVNTLSYHYISGLTIPEKKFITNFCDLPIKIYGYGYPEGRIIFKLLKPQPLSINDIKTRVSNIVLTKNIDGSSYDSSYDYTNEDSYKHLGIPNQTKLVSLIGILVVVTLILIIIIFFIWNKNRNRNY